jgi:hypothetical protein
VRDEVGALIHQVQSPCAIERKDLPTNFTSRCAEFAALIDLLLEERAGAPVTALRGAGGFGNPTQQSPWSASISARTCSIS